MHNIGVVIHPGINFMSLALTSVWELVNLAMGKPYYRMQVLSEMGGLVRTSLGAMIDTEPFHRPHFDTLMFTAGANPLAMAPSDGVLAFARKAVHASRRVVAPCTGAFLLAEAGVLDGRRATTHWFFARQLRERYPKVKLEEDRIFVTDGPLWTSAGMTAGIDLALAIVENDVGPEIARAVAKKMVVYHRRGGGQSQFSALLDIEPKSDRIQTALIYAREHLRTELSVERLADVAHLSPRQFSRTFHSETGQSPAKAIENLRVEAARTMMEEGRFPMDIVARETGFGDRERMRRAFLRAFGQPPQTIRRNATAFA